MIKRFQHYCKKEKLFSKGQKILLTVSGGIDSMVMLKLFELSGLNFGIAHGNFHLRGAESDADTEFVRGVADKLNVPFFAKDFNTAGYAAREKLSIQQAARDLRYRWFEKLIDDTGFNLYATAHHFDDQIETFFINLLRGTGVSGLCGMPLRQGRCIRPLLFATREEIENFARQNKVLFREDSSNLETKYLRNKIRHFVLPSLEKANKDYRKSFSQTFDNLNDTLAFLKNEIEKIKKEVIRKKGEHTIISTEKLRQYAPVKYVLFEILKDYQFNSAKVSDIVKHLGRSSGKIFYAPHHQALLDRDALIISILKNPSDQKEDVILVENGAGFMDHPVKMTFEKKPKDANFKIDPDPGSAQLDYHKLEYPLRIRKPETGDYFFPLGLGGRKLLSDFFSDLKLPAVEKQQVRVLLSGSRIAWVIGLRMDDRFKVDSSTQEIFYIRLIE